MAVSLNTVVRKGGASIGCAHSPVGHVQGCVRPSPPLLPHGRGGRALGFVCASTEALDFLCLDRGSWFFLCLTGGSSIFVLQRRLLDLFVPRPRHKQIPRASVEERKNQKSLRRGTQKFKSLRRDTPWAPRD